MAETESAGSAEAQIGLEKGDRVKRSGSEGPFGTVQGVRMETMRQSVKVTGTEPPGVTVTVLWDNGTQSHFVPTTLEKVAN